jgi:membrane-associated protease RseP (regulator of RpoE activity)
VVAIGNPVGLTNTVTSGVVSSTDRPFLQIGGIIQIDAALNPGNSGGALINNDGYLVGIAFAGLANFENLNFAIPSNHMISILRKLYSGGETSRSWAGCALDQRDGEITVEYLAPRSPAELSGLQEGDIIRSVNGRDVSSIYDIQELFSNLNNPIVVSMIIDRDGKIMNKRLVLAERPVHPSVHIYERDAVENIMIPLFGMVISKLEPERKKNYVVNRTLSNSVATSVGIAEGDEIRLRDLKYDENAQAFFLIIDLKSKRFGYINRSMVLYRFIAVTNFI